jgi:myosin V
MDKKENGHVLRLDDIFSHHHHHHHHHHKVLNEECMLAKGGDAQFTSKLSSLHEEHPHYVKDRLNRLDFSIHHYAGTVTYTAANFVARNRDTLLEDLSSVLGQSQVPLVQALFAPPSEDGVVSPTAAGGGTGATKRKGAGTIAAESVVTKFRRQLTDLMATVAATRVRYIRCIKPNQAKAPTAMEPLMVTEQLRCAGVIEAIRISRAAYPNRLPHDECLRRFRLLHAGRTDQQAAGKALAAAGKDEGVAAAAAVRRLLEELLPPGSSAATGRQRWEMGRTRVYFAKGALEELEERRLGVLASNATTVQRYWRGTRQRGAYRRQRAAAVVVESRVRGWRQRRWYVRERARIVRLQALWRRRRDARRVEALRREKRATTIQAAYRRHLHQGRYRRLRGGAVRLQAVARQRAARAAYVAALAEAKEQAKLENQLEALKRRLEEESAARRAAEEQLAQQQQEQGEVVRSPGGTEQQQPQLLQGGGASLAAVAASNAQAQALSMEQGQWLELLREKVGWEWVVVEGWGVCVVVGGWGLETGGPTTAWMAGPTTSRLLPTTPASNRRTPPPHR